MATVSPAPLPKPVDKYVTPTERIFNNGIIGAYGAAPAAGDDEADEYQNLVTALVDDAQSFEESTLAPDREENLEYFYGEIPEPEGEGTSTAVSTDFRDTVMAIMPSLIRIFTSAEHVVSCRPNFDGQEDAARQCTEYLEYMFWVDNPGFLIIHDILKDALRCKIGVVEWDTDVTEEVTEQVYHNISIEQIQQLYFENPSLEVLEMVPLPEYSNVVAFSESQTPMFASVRVRFIKSKPITRVESVPLDEFRISRKAKSVKTAQLVGRDRIVDVSELVKLGYDYDEMMHYAGATSTYSTDRQYRNAGMDETSITSDQEVRYGCYYIRIDRDGDGIAELRKIRTVGDAHTIIYDEVVQHANFAVWSPDPEPHTVVGDTPAELVKDIQRIKTNMLRGALDSLAQSIWPRTVFNETLVNVDDVLNDEIGASIRTRGNPMETVQSLTHQFVGQPVFAMFDVMEQLRRSRTGIDESSKGLDPKALQSVAVGGVQQIIDGAQERIELCARILAETGMKDLFEGLLRECVNSPNQERTVQLRGRWVTINPSTFDPNMKIGVNPTLGKGSDQTRLMALMDVRATQQMAMEKFGVDNPLCGPIEFRNTLVDMLAIANIKNDTRYFKIITPEVLEMIKAAPKEPDPATLLAQAELEKTRAKTAEAIAKDATDRHKIKVDDDFRRDELTVRGILDAAELEAQWGAEIDEREIEAANTAISLVEAENNLGFPNAGT